MHTGKSFRLGEALVWTRRDIYKYFIIATIPTVVYQLWGCKWLGLPWLPIALVGTAVAFLVGFKNNATYDRLWEARKIWGAIVNTSRTWGIMARDFVTNRHVTQTLTDAELHTIRQRLIYRHLAWLTALRYQLRQPREWESMTKSYNVEYKRFFKVPEEETALTDELDKYLSPAEKAYVLGKKNVATQILGLQSGELTALRDKGLIDDFRHMKLAGQLADMYDHQGKCERIKNFPYPRQFATLNLYFVWLFIILIPLGMIQEFVKMGEGFVWFTIPFSTLVSWVFHTMEKIGEATENPFQGGANDIPMAALSRTIEIDLRDMLDEADLPAPLQSVNNILM